MLETITAVSKKPKSKFKGVVAFITQGKYLVWRAQLIVNKKKEYSYHNTEIEAAKRYDMYLIRNGKKPVNVLKPK